MHAFTCAPHPDGHGWAKAVPLTVVRLAMASAKARRMDNFIFYTS
jgi:hypothetical protein